MEPITLPSDDTPLFDSLASAFNSPDSTIDAVSGIFSCYPWRRTADRTGYLWPDDANDIIRDDDWVKVLTDVRSRSVLGRLKKALSAHMNVDGPIAMDEDPMKSAWSMSLHDGSLYMRPMLYCVLHERRPGYGSWQRARLNEIEKLNGGHVAPMTRLRRSAEDHFAKSDDPFTIGRAKTAMDMNITVNALRRDFPYDDFEMAWDGTAISVLKV